MSLELLARGPARPDLREDLVVAEADLAEVLGRWSAPPPVAVPAGSGPAAGSGSGPAAGLPGLDAVAGVLAAGSPALVEVAPGLAGPGPAADHLADLLAVAAHSGVGFGAGLVPRCADADQVWALLSGAVAAMTGADVRAALAHPDPAALVALSRSAREAVRDVVTCVVVPAADVARVTAELTAAG